MGKNSVVQQVVRGVTDVVVAPARETARVVGAEGVVEGWDNVKKEVDSGFQQIGDLASGDNKKQAAESAAMEAAKEAEAVKEVEADTKKKETEANNAIEEKRMSAGSRSRTLLTGPKGLDEETDSTGKKITISRRTLKAR